MTTPGMGTTLMARLPMNLRGFTLERRRTARTASLLQVLLVVILGRVEGLSGLDERDDGLTVPRLLLLLRLSSNLLLLGIVEEDR